MAVWVMVAEEWDRGAAPVEISPSGNRGHSQSDWYLAVGPKAPLVKRNSRCAERQYAINLTIRRVLSCYLADIAQVASAKSTRRAVQRVRKTTSPR